MEQHVLYLVLKEICKALDTQFTYSSDDMDSNAGNVVGIYIKGGGPSQYRTLAKGKYYNYVNRVQFLIQGSDNIDSLMDCKRLGSKIRDTLISTFNVLITAPSKIGINVDGEIVLRKGTEELSDVQVLISQIDLLGEPEPIGKNEQGKPRRSINFIIKYEIGGN